VDSKDAGVCILTAFDVKFLLWAGCRGCIKDAPIYDEDAEDAKDADYIWNTALIPPGMKPLL
jgi:hypothetical protein